MVLEFIRNKLKDQDSEGNSARKPETEQRDQSDQTTFGGRTANVECYESATTRETCQTNSKGDLVCDRINQIWQICPGKKPVLVSSTKEEGVHTEEIPRITMSPITPFFGGGDPIASMLREMDDLVRHFEQPQNFPVPTRSPFSDFGVPNPNHGADDIRQRPDPKIRSDFPEPEHWRK
eukprot:TRINITY_DN5014_c0_g1_i1.p1 TRINITY_DN5014_c0_g1~~TRINITY_DN5014_c0_g1_i1.p1  ORF type:complete len:178 (-),score=17.99 TRINITY_DN5014_c0_g1_i1:136-669(-)